MPDYHRRRQAALLLEVSEWKLQQWMRSGRVAVARVDGCVWVDVDSARALIEDGRTEPVMRSIGSPRTTLTDIYAESLAYFASPPATVSPHKAKRRA